VAELTEAALQTRLKQAMKGRDVLQTSVLRGVIAGIKNARVEQRGTELSSEQVIAVVRRELKKRDEVIEFARQGQREDVLRQNQAERAVLAALLPPTLDPSELEAAVRRYCDEGASAIGEVMRRLQGEFPGRIDGKLANAVARRILAG
jgi:hypothetical protein